MALTLTQGSPGTAGSTSQARPNVNPNPGRALAAGASALICALYRALRFLGALCRMWQPERTDPSDDAGGTIPRGIGGI